MLLRNWLLVLIFAAPGWWGSAPVRAQCLPLDLLAPGIAAGRIAPDSVTELMEPSEWTLHYGSNPYWTYHTPGKTDTPEEQAEAWVSLRRSNQQPYYDLVYKTTHRACINQIRADLRHEAKLKSEPINCVQCDGERLVGKGYTVSIFIQKEGYSAKRTAYPFVLVLRRSTAGGKGSELPPEVSSRLTSEH